MSGASGTASTREEATLRRAHRFELAARDMDEVALAATWLKSQNRGFIYVNPQHIVRIEPTGGSGADEEPRID